MGGSQSTAGKSGAGGPGGDIDPAAPAPPAQSSAATAGGGEEAGEQPQGSSSTEERRRLVELARLRQRLLRPALLIPAPARAEQEKDHALVLDLMEFFCFAVKVTFPSPGWMCV